MKYDKYDFDSDDEIAAIAVADAIRDRCEQLGRSRQSIADEMGMFLYRLSEIERGRRKTMLTPREVQLLIAVLGDDVFRPGAAIVAAACAKAERRQEKRKKREAKKSPVLRRPSQVVAAIAAIAEDEPIPPVPYLLRDAYGGTLEKWQKFLERPTLQAKVVAVRTLEGMGM